MSLKKIRSIRFIKKSVYFFLIGFFFINCNSDPNYLGKIYILSRNSQSKEGNIVLKYNNTPNKLSHIGIALSLSKDAYVYDMSYDSLNSMGSSLIKENIKSFWCSPNPKDNRAWEIKCSKDNFKNAYLLLQKYNSQKIEFDFDPSTKNGFYCSEFVYNILYQTDPKRFFYKPICKKIDGFERIISRKDTLCYYPVDFFLEYKNIKEVKSQ